MSPLRSGDVTGLAEFAIELATGAAGLVSRAERIGLGVGVKSTDTDLVTEVDRSCEHWLIEQIAAFRPDDAVLGEEGGGRDGTSGVRWVLDPIDGTVNFVLGLPQYAVSVAAELDGRVVAGAVCNPVTGEIFHASLGGGAFLGAERLHGPRTVDLHRCVIGTGFSYHAERRVRQAAVVTRLLARIGDIRRLGAASLDLCAVACGRLDGYFEAGLNPWDYSAGGLVAAEAGCVVGGLRDRPVSPRMAAACGETLAPALFAVLEEFGADSVVEP
jgi:myo-inositol-1(or 4)-monophosphatase